MKPIKNGKYVYITIGKDSDCWYRESGSYGMSAHQSRVVSLGIKNLIGLVFVNAWGW